MIASINYTSKFLFNITCKKKKGKKINHREEVKVP